MGGGSSKQKASIKSDNLEKVIEIRKDEQDEMKNEVRESVVSH
jgi:hypothetical protein